MSTKQKLPAIDSTQGVSDPATRKILNQLKEIIETREHNRGGFLEKGVTVRDLINAGIASAQGTNLNQNDTVVTIINDNSNLDSGFTDQTVPTTPTGLTANGAFENVLLTWDSASYSNHAYTEIWRSGTDDIGTATKVGTSRSSIYADPVGGGASNYYWIRFVSLANLVGSYNDTNGTLGTTAADPAYLRSQLADQIQETELYSTLNDRIDLIDDASTGLTRQYILKVNDKGHITGIGFGTTNPVDEAPFSDFIIQADRISFVTPAATWLASTAYAENQFVIPTDQTGIPNSIVYKCTTAGTTGATEPSWNTVVGQTNNDGTAVWTAFTRQELFPFVLSGDTLYLDTASIENTSITDAKIGTLNADKLFVTSGTIASALIGTGEITDLMIGSYIQSTNYSAGNAGWKINKDGSAEFHNLIVYDSNGDAIFQSGGRTLNRTFVNATEPTTGVIDGDLWIDTGNSNRINVRESGVWQARQDGAISTSQQTADGKNTVFVAGNAGNTYEPTATRIGDIWFDTDDDDALHRWSGSAWVDLGSVAAALTAAQNAQSTADGKINVFYQTGIPSNGTGDDGDFSIDTSNNKMYTKTSGVWGETLSDDIAQAITDAANADAKADGKVTTFFALSSSAPTAEGNGDLWFETDTKILKRWDGANWVPAGLGDLAAIDQITTGNASTYIQSASIDTLQLAGQSVTFPTTAINRGNGTLYDETDDTDWLTVQSSTVTGVENSAPILTWAKSNFWLEVESSVPSTDCTVDLRVRITFTYENPPGFTVNTVPIDDETILTVTSTGSGNVVTSSVDFFDMFSYTVPHTADQDVLFEFRTVKTTGSGTWDFRAIDRSLVSIHTKR